MSSNAGSLGFSRLALLIARRWKFVLVMVLVFALLSLAWRLTTPRVYRASVLVAVVDEKDSLSGGLSALVGQLGPLASLAGGLGGDHDAEAIAILQSRALSSQYIKANNLLPILFPEKWDADRKSWKDGLRRVPTVWDGVEKFKKLRRVAQDSKSRLVTVTVDWTDAQLATTWCNDFIRLTNEILREKELVAARKNITYLSAQARVVDRIEVQNAVSALIQREMKREMLASGAADFALTVIDPAVVPEKPSPPGITLSLLIGMLAGLFLAVFLSFMKLTMDIRSSDSVS